ncbi:3' exoribonuclease family, domain 1-domain-containing protein [Obelidium mucronatum]|nr:3' exoribonuclease family, domain 1-domain-containing protein [Obelidium mucronatum]
MDSRRIKGPEKTLPPLPPLNPAPSKTANINNNRSDGRSKEQVRPVFAKTGMVRQANGSAYLEVGGVKLVCAVYGPKPITGAAQKSADHHSGGRISCDVRLSPFAGIKRKGFQKESNEKTLSTNLSTSILPSLLLTHLPKSQIDIHIQVLQALDPIETTQANAFSTSLSLLLAPCITVASLALADAGIEMMDSVVGCHVGIYRNHANNRLFWMVDCADDEVETRCNGGGTWVGNCVIGVMPSIGKVTGMVMDGDIGDVGFVMEAVQVCMDASAKIHDVVVKKVLVEAAESQLE